MPNELKPSPFCGGEAHLIQTKCLSNDCVFYHIYHRGLQCPIDEIRTINRETPKEAIEDWGRRADNG